MKPMTTSAAVIAVALLVVNIRALIVLRESDMRLRCVHNCDGPTLSATHVASGASSFDNRQRENASSTNTHTTSTCRDRAGDADELVHIAKEFDPVTDKVTSHQYQLMYGTFLMPLRHRGAIKLLEIGLGCNMVYGPGASAKLWKKLFPDAQLWEADVDADCVEKAKAKGQLSGINVVTGDQGNVNVVKQWVSETGGQFDAVIDDGSHKNSHLKKSFDTIWPAVKPGGLYFLEDLQVGREGGYEDSRGQAVMSDIIQAWIEQLLVEHPYTLKSADRFPLPSGVESIFCQSQACVVIKSRSAS